MNQIKNKKLLQTVETDLVSKVKMSKIVLKLILETVIFAIKIISYISCMNNFLFWPKISHKNRII